jgi:hypothetical protein
MKENWKSIRGYAGLYEVSDLGNIRRITPYNNSTDAPLVASIVAGYPRVTLSKENQRRAHLVHRLVADAFIGLKRGLVVNHLSGVKTDNRLANLELVTRKENERHKWDVLRTGGRGRAKLSFEKADEIRRLKAEGASYRELAKQFGVSPGTITFIINGTTWIRR